MPEIEMYLQACQSHGIVGDLPVQHRQIDQLLHKGRFPHAYLEVRTAQVARRMIQLVDEGPLVHALIRRILVLILVTDADLAIALKLCSQSGVVPAMLVIQHSPRSASAPNPAVFFSASYRSTKR